MRVLFAATLTALLAAIPVRADTIDGRVIQVRLPAQDVTLSYVERKGGFTVELETRDAAVEGQRLFIGNGTVAIELIAHPFKGIFLQGESYQQGNQFKRGFIIKVRPGYKKASELKPGDVYVTLPGVTFELPGK